MKFVFADDSRQSSPVRTGMGPLVAIGGLLVPATHLRDLEASLQAECVGAGFPVREEFKWSPGRTHWMHQHLVGAARRKFFKRVLARATEAGCTVVVVVADSNYASATGASTPEADVTHMFLERVTAALGRADGVVIVDRPSGGHKDEDKFLSRCFETFQSGAKFVLPQRIAINVLCTSSHLVRLLQLADLVTGATTAFVAGERRHSPKLFQLIKPMLRQELRRVGGVGIKIHPDGRYANLYHWLAGDTVFVRSSRGWKLPMADRPYGRDANTPDG